MREEYSDYSLPPSWSIHEDGASHGEGMLWDRNVEVLQLFEPSREAGQPRYRLTDLGSLGDRVGGFDHKYEVPRDPWVVRDEAYSSGVHLQCPIRVRNIEHVLPSVPHVHGEDCGERSPDSGTLTVGPKDPYLHIQTQSGPMLQAERAGVQRISTGVSPPRFDRGSAEVLENRVLGCRPASGPPRARARGARLTMAGDRQASHERRRHRSIPVGQGGSGLLLVGELRCGEPT